MKLISHRGNLNGTNKDLENNPNQVDNVLSKGYDCEIDLYVRNKKFYLGHDSERYPINLDWIYERKKNLWIHCKNTEALETLFDHKELNYFWHENDTVTITSRGYLWVYVGKQPVKNSIAVLPEKNNEKIDGCIGVCSDIIERYK